MPLGNIQRCYGRKNYIKEKSFVKDFFDGKNSSESDSFVFQTRFQKKHQENQNDNNKENIDVGALKSRTFFDSSSENDSKENIDVGTRESPILFDLTSGNVTQEMKRSLANKNVRKKPICGNKNGKKNIKGIQHLSTKFCKSKQPAWSEFDNFKFTVEKLPYIHADERRIFISEETSCEISDSEKEPVFEEKSDVSKTDNIKTQKVKQSIIFPKSHISTGNNNIFRENYLFPVADSINSSGELFLPTPVKKKSLKKKKSIQKKKTVDNKKSKNKVTELDKSYDSCERVDSPGLKGVKICSNLQKSSKQMKFQQPLLNLLDSSSDSIALLGQKEVSCLNAESSSAVSSDILCPENKAVTVTTSSFSKNLISHKGISDNFQNDSDENFSVFLTSLHDISKNDQSKNLGASGLGSTKNISYFRKNLSEQMKIQKPLLNLLDSSSDSIALLEQKEMPCLNPETSSAVSNDKQCQDNKTVSGFESTKNISYSESSLEHMEIDTEVIHAADEKECSKSIEMVPNEENLSFADYRHSSMLNSANGIKTIPNKKCDQNSCKSSLSLGKRKFTESQLNLFSKMENCKIKAYGKISIHDEVNVSRESNLVSCSPNISNFSKGRASDLLKKQGKFVTSTPMMKNKNLNSINADILHLLQSENILDDYVNLSDIEKKENCTDKYLDMQSGLMKNSLLALKSQRSLDVSIRKSITPKSLHKSRSLINLTASKDESHFHGKTDGFTKTKLLELCDQDSVISFADIYDWKKLKVKKIGEGTYGEVFMISKGKKSSVLKIIAVTEDPNVKNLQGISSVYSEIKVTKALSGLRNNKMNQSKNYVKVERASIVCGTYPSQLLAAWDNFSETKSCYNDRPDMYGETQLFAILELQFGGKDMSCFALRNAVEAECILKQIAVSLAIAEEAFLFEHRDIHLGNILVQRSNRKKISYKLRGKDISFECHGLQVTIIDFTLSLLHENGYVYYNDLADDISLFEQSGDYQFEVYKLMKKHLENKWQECSLYSNVLWLKYLCHKLKESKYSRPSTALHKKGLKAIDFFEQKLTDCNCALECLFKWGITNTAYEKHSLPLNCTRNSILVSRSSMQKSK